MEEFHPSPRRNGGNDGNERDGSGGLSEEAENLLIAIWSFLVGFVGFLVCGIYAVKLMWPGILTFDISIYFLNIIIYNEIYEKFIIST